jgi:hypothetical protein
METTLKIHIPLDHAMLCCNEDCEAIFELGPEQCPACTQKHIVPLQALMEHRLEVA